MSTENASHSPASLPETARRALWIRRTARGVVIEPVAVLSFSTASQTAELATGRDFSGRVSPVSLAQLASTPARVSEIIAGLSAELLAGNAAPAKMPAPVSDTQRAA